MYTGTEDVQIAVTLGMKRNRQAELNVLFTFVSIFVQSHQHKPILGKVHEKCHERWEATWSQALAPYPVAVWLGRLP